MCEAPSGGLGGGGKKHNTRLAKASPLHPNHRGARPRLTAQGDPLGGQLSAGRQCSRWGCEAPANICSPVIPVSAFGAGRGREVKQLEWLCFHPDPLSSYLLPSLSGGRSGLVLYTFKLRPPFHSPPLPLPPSIISGLCLTYV